MLMVNQLVGFGASTEPAKYRYARVTISSQPYTGDSVVREFEFSADGSTWFQSGTASANNEGGGAASQAIDGNTATYWQALAWPNYWQIDFGAGNEKEIHYWRHRTFTISADRTITGGTLKLSNTGAFAGEEVTHAFSHTSTGVDNIWVQQGPF